MKKAKLNKEFYTLLEPVLQDAGYETYYMANHFLCINGKLHFAINHHHGSQDSAYERVWLENRFKDARAKELFEEEGILLITNRLSGIYPEFNVVCSNDGRVRIRYSCDIVKLEDLLPHITYACDFFEKIQAEAMHAITDMYELYHNKNINKSK